MMQGRRLQLDAEGDYPYNAIEPGVYFLWRGKWYGVTPNGLMANLGGHQITEHEDGTITVSPSIFVNQGQEPNWHGFLERGVWREC